MKVLWWILLVLTAVGAINWGLMGFFQFDLVSYVTFDLLGLVTYPVVATVVYDVVGVAGLLLLVMTILKKCGCCCGDCCK